MKTVRQKQSQKNKQSRQNRRNCQQNDKKPIFRHFLPCPDSPTARQKTTHSTPLYAPQQNNAAKANTASKQAKNTQILKSRRRTQKVLRKVRDPLQSSKPIAKSENPLQSSKPTTKPKNPLTKHKNHTQKPKSASKSSYSAA